MAVCLPNVQAGTLILPNGSFESPATTFVDTRVDGWEKAPKPFWYDESGGFYWDQLAGVFANTPAGSADHIDNCDQSQGVYLFAVPENGIFQDYDSSDWSTNGPLHAFNARYGVGKSYALTIGAIGGGGNMAEGVTLEVSLYYRDPASNRVAVGTTTITNSHSLFTNMTHFVDFRLQIPAVKSSDLWAGKRIGIEIKSTVNPALAGGYWDLDNVRLAETIEVPNGSFEGPATPFVDTRVDEWQKTPKPFWYDESGGFYWDQLSGVFANTASGSPDHIDNCDGAQGLYLFALPEAGVFQENNTVDWAHASPLHHFGAQYEAGRAYRLAVGVVGGGGNMAPGLTLELSLYYRDAASNLVIVSSTTVTNNATTFPNTTHLVDFQVNTPAVRANDPWAGKQIGIRFLSTANPALAGGYWDLDQVRLSEVIAPAATLRAVKDGANVQLQWLAAAGYTYQVQVSPDLQSWSDYEAPIAGTGWEVTRTVPFSAFANGFFRLVSSPRP